ncbi:hypothetical protein A2382_02440 [Candidatus Woesebacteria bacterium RIFOXYB1_FULL_38_16]|uniref:Right handed beta helix domain-containing protein n=1 Tax=Candidatus Woesebacteria bacterium RIFOXYB1_FULL_38_16 TaxID=1802538 RepID=A0A1F8CTA7_9BACT|nr:MAG: hypothetical protein A2191_01065 [Candidatus Woesebacteria bacterium RIFOXYA1_FULL_38_9]OGM79583.1 MAG: hypothetical protein A2382_02440 [Candidatus Woesebacteria bacterium RIFOXYB1_FULL_38_16]
MRNILLGILVVWVFIMVSATEALARDYYIDGNNGNNSNNGSIDAPWKTVQKAATAMVAGDTANIKGNITYTESITVAQNGTAGSRIIYQAWPGTGTPTLSCAGTGNYLFKNFLKSYVTLSGLKLYCNIGKTIDSGIATGIIIKNNIFIGTDTAIVSLLNTSLKIYNNVFYSQDVGIQTLSDNSIDIKNNIFINGTTAISKSAGTVVIGNNLFYNNSTSNCSGCTLDATNTTSQDPLLFDISQNDFRLKFGSPAIDAGVNDASVTTDIAGAGRPKGESTDIGVYEYFDYALDLMSFSESSNNQAPLFSFRPRVGITTGYFSFKVELDPGKNRTFSEGFIPNTSPDTTTSNYSFKNTDQVSVNYIDWHDSETTNNKIEVLFKDIIQAGRGLTEGRHTWKVTMTDRANDSTTSTHDFLVDLTPPTISSLTIINPLNQKAFSVPSGGSGKRVYILDITNRLPTLWVKFTDPKSGSTRTNDNNTKDSFPEGAAGLNSLNLTVNRLTGENTNQCTQTDFTLQQEIPVSLTQNQTEVTLKPKFPLVNGTYQLTLTTDDKAGNKTIYPSFYLTLSTPTQCLYVNQSRI